MVSGRSSAADAICPRVVSRAGPTNDHAKPPANAPTSAQAGRSPVAAPLSAHQRQASPTRNIAWAAWMTRPGATRSHTTPANQPKTMELPKARPKPSPDSRSEPTASCR